MLAHLYDTEVRRLLLSMRELVGSPDGMKDALRKMKLYAREAPTRGDGFTPTIAFNIQLWTAQAQLFDNKTKNEGIQRLVIAVQRAHNQGWVWKQRRAQMLLARARLG